MNNPCLRRSCRSSNLLAVCVASAGFAILYTSFDPVPAGEEIRGETQSLTSAAEFVIREQASDLVPLPPGEVAAELVPAESDGDTAVSAAAATTVRPTPSGIVLDNNEAIRFSLLLLREGATYLQNIRHYSTVFSKQERINGDLSENQIIEMKVQHGPSFSVYMKWKNGDTGRQVLYSDQYEDRQMVVKLGGLKGRLLPAIKLDPCGERAMSEARYPVTEAGIMGMLKQIIAHREADLKRGYGVICRRLPNQQFDERECMCFVYEYETAECSPVYRKSLILIDSRHGIPIMARNYTWARDAEDLSSEELDQQTLIENYSFTSLNPTIELATDDFSRSNPKYRM